MSSFGRRGRRTGRKADDSISLMGMCPNRRRFFNSIKPDRLPSRENLDRVDAYLPGRYYLHKVPFEVDSLHGVWFISSLIAQFCAW